MGIVEWSENPSTLTGAGGGAGLAALVPGWTLNTTPSCVDFYLLGLGLSGLYASSHLTSQPPYGGGFYLYPIFQMWKRSLIYLLKVT